MCQKSVEVANAAGKREMLSSEYLIRKPKERGTVLKIDGIYS